MKQQRGCKKPGEDYTLTGRAIAFTSLMLQGDGDRVLNECPVGRVLREAPHTYDLINHIGLAENAGPTEAEQMSRLWSDAGRLYSSEKRRIDDIERARDKTKGDAAYGARVRAR